MLNPRFIDDMSWSMAEVYGAVCDRILINLAKYFPYIQRSGEVKGSFEYQARMLAQMGQVNRETIDIIVKSLGGADAALRSALEQSIIEALKDEDPKLRKAAERGILLPPATPEVAPNQMRAFQLYYKQASDKLNLVNTNILRSTQAVYQQTVANAANLIERTQSIMNISAGEVISGVSTYNEAMHDAVRKMVDNGLTGFYDSAKRKWSPEAYVAMDIRTTMANTAREAVWEDNERYGNDLYQVSAHPGSRPGCYPYQLWVVSTSGRQGTTTDFDGNTIIIHNQDEIKDFKYGGGLFGVNCGHYPIGFVPGISPIRGEIQPKEENDALYAEMQGQRNLERQLRYEKRDLEVMKSQGANPDAIKAQKERVDAARTKLKDYCEEHGLPRYRNREYTPVNATWPENPSPPKPPTDPNPQTNIHLVPDNIPPQAQTQAVQPAQNVVQLDSVEQAVGVKKGKPIPMGEARTWTNADFSTGDWEYNNNCQRCVQAYELRRRGYNVEATPRPRTDNPIRMGSELFNGYGKSRIDAVQAYTMQQTEEQVKAELANAPDGARYSIYVKWSHLKSSHVFVAEKSNGTVYYLDPQTNKRDVSSYFGNGAQGQFGFFRMDDKPITTDESLIAAAVRRGQTYEP